VLATPGALKQVEKIRSQAEVRRAEQNSELKGLADQINGITVVFPAKAGETGKLYGSITTQDVATAIQEKTRFEVKKQQIDMQPIRNLGEYTAHVRLTMDLVPEVKIIVHREGEAIDDGTSLQAEPVQEQQAEAPAEVPAAATEATEA
jgi:large subunit ribosomal protein L9